MNHRWHGNYPRNVCQRVSRRFQRHLPDVWGTRYKFRKVSEPVAREMSHKSSVRFLWRNGEPCWSAGWRTGEFVGRGGSAGGWFMRRCNLYTCIYVTSRSVILLSLRSVRSSSSLRAAFLARFHQSETRNLPTSSSLIVPRITISFLHFTPPFFFLSLFFFFSLLSIDRLTLPIRFLTRRADE